MNELPPELKAMKGMMDMVFGAIAAPQVPVERDDTLENIRPAVAAQVSKRQIDIESAILRVAPFDYLTASEIFAALHRRLELRYENLNPKVLEALQGLSRAFEQVS